MNKTNLCLMCQMILCSVNISSKMLNFSFKSLINKWKGPDQVIQGDVCDLHFNEWSVCLCVWLIWVISSIMCCCISPPSHSFTASQRVEELCESFVPRVRVVQVTGMTRPFHHHHAVIGQIAQVAEWQLSQQSVLVTVDDERWDLEGKSQTSY